MDEALDAFCLKDLVLTSALEDLCLEEICLDDHHVSLIIPAHRVEGRILHDPPSPASQFKSINILAFSLLYRPTLTSVHEYWKNHRFD